MAAPEGPASTATQRYEALRRQALGTPEHSAAALGLAVLVHRGVAAWVDIAPATAELTGGEGAAAHDGPLVTRGGLVACIAQILLGRRTG